MRLRLLPLLALALACSQSESSDDPQATLVKRGKQVFETNCTACHAFDPTQPGPVGPPIAGSSLELVRAKVVHNEYPPGYTPKRTTKAMIPLTHLEPDVPAIAAYLESLGGSKAQ